MMRKGTTRLKSSSRAYIMRRSMTEAAPPTGKTTRGDDLHR